jgi:uncharacterized protein (TIGR03437 family)
MMEIKLPSRPPNGSSGSLWRRVCGILPLLVPLATMPAATSSNLNVIVSSETAPPGATVQIKLSLAKPAAVSSGELALDLDPTVFGPVTAIATFSAAGDACGYAIISGSHVDIHFASPSATLGSAAGMPLVVITVPTLASANAGTQATVTADPTGSPWNGPDGTVYTVTVTPGSVTLGGSLSVSDVSPVSNLAAGAVVHIRGGGFTSATTVDIAAVSAASVQLVGPQEIDVTLAGPANLGGKRITMQNPGGPLVDFFAAPPGTPLPSIGDVFDGALALFPTASYPAGTGNFSEADTFGRVALANPNATPVNVLLQVRDPGGVQQMTLTVPAGGTYNNDFHSLNAAGKSVWVIATAPLRMVESRGHPSYLGQAPSYEFAPFTPTSIAPLGISVGSGATAQFMWVAGAPPPQPQTVTVYPTLDTDVSFMVSSSTTSGGNWLSVTPTSGIICQPNVTCPAFPVLTVTANPTGLGPGIYRGTVTITPLPTQFQPAGPPVSFPVALTVTAAPLVNHIVTGTYFQTGPPATLSNTLTLPPESLPGPFAVDVVTDSGGNWLSATPLSGTTPAQLQLSAAPGNLGPGVYAGTVMVNGSGGNTFVVEAVLNISGKVQLAPVGSPVFAQSPGEPPSSPQTVPVYLRCLCTASELPNQVTWTTSVSTHSGGNWLRATSSFITTSPGSVTISVDPTGLAPAVYTGVVTLTSDQAGQAQIPVALNVWNGPLPALFANPAAISLTASPFASPVADAADICTYTGSLVVQQSARATTSNGGNWFGVAVVTDVTSSCGIRLSIDPSHLDAGVYQGDVTISVPGQTLDVPVTLTIPPPINLNAFYQPVIGSVLNAASFNQGAIAPGEIITLRGFGLGTVGGNSAGTTFTVDTSGHLPVNLAGTEVLFDGKPSPVLYESPSQVNTIVPYEVAGRNAATVQVIISGGISQAWSVPVAPTAPGIFTLDSTGAGQAAVLNEDNSVNGPAQPAARGSVIQIFATGILVAGAVTGSITPAAAPGSTDPVSVAIGGVTASIQYAGPAPGEIAGLIQVNAVVPDNAPTGPAVPIILSVSPPQGPLQPTIYASQFGATIAVQ